jgi:hypothetical protein
MMQNMVQFFTPGNPDSLSLEGSHHHLGSGASLLAVVPDL